MNPKRTLSTIQIVPERSGYISFSVTNVLHFSDLTFFGEMLLHIFPFLTPLHRVLMPQHPLTLQQKQEETLPALG